MSGFDQSVPAMLRGKWAALAVVYALGVLIVSLLPASGSTLGATGPLGLFALDLWFHTVGYAVLGALAGTAVVLEGRRVMIGIVVAVVAYGLLIEGLQGLVVTRAPSLLDAAANAVGAVVGVGLRSLSR